MYNWYLKFYLLCINLSKMDRNQSGFSHFFLVKFAGCNFLKCIYLMLTKLSVAIHSPLLKTKLLLT
jgi:hypothetical protein